FLNYGLVVRFRLLPTPPLGDAVSFSYGQPVFCPMGTSTPLLVRTLRRTKRRLQPLHLCLGRLQPLHLFKARETREKTRKSSLIRSRLPRFGAARLSSPKSLPYRSLALAKITILGELRCQVLRQPGVPV